MPLALVLFKLLDMALLGTNAALRAKEHRDRLAGLVAKHGKHIPKATIKAIEAEVDAELEELRRLAEAPEDGSEG